MQAHKADSDLLRRTVQACRVCSLEPWCLTWNLGPEDAQRVEQIIAHPTPLNAGDALYRDGDGLRAIYAVRSGAFKKSRNGGPGDEQVLGFSLPGELLGLDGVHSRQYRSTAVALEASTVCILPYSELTSLMGLSGGLRDEIMRRASADFDDEPNHSTAPEQRLAGFLLDLSARRQANGGSATELKLPMSQEDIGAYLGVSADAVGRLFSDLASQQLVSLERRGLRLLDPERLGLLAQNGL